MKIRAILGVIAVIGLASGAAHAVSDGNYSPQRNHCSGYADNVERPDYAEEGCHNGTVTVSDLGGHEYFGFGLAQTTTSDRGPVPDVLPFDLGANLHKTDFWYDSGSGCTRYVFDAKTPGAPVSGACPWFNRKAPNYYGPDQAAHPEKGIRFYFGFDDNAAGGEHDSSELINNGPSDGGGINVVLDPNAVMPWVNAVMAQDAQYVLTHPLPAGYGGVGFCADGICFALHTQRQVAYQGGSKNAPSRDVYNYDGKNWDPEGCSGDDDGSKKGDKACDDPHKGGTQDITYWYNQDGTVYTEPGVQIFEDPDPQGSPIGGGYPIPSLYVGTCGIVIGGGSDFAMPDSPVSNHSGQWVIPTGC